MVAKTSQHTRAIQLRQQGKSLSEITQALRISKSSASTWVRKVILSPRQIQRLKHRQIQAALKANEKRRKIRTTTKKSRPVDYFFRVWNPGMAYVLGYFAADGCMYKTTSNQGHFIEFVSIDKELIELTKTLMQAQNKIEVLNRSNRQPRYKLRICSRKLFNQLLNLGFTPAKSLTLKFPTVPDQYLSHFVRGYFDGDGCISFGNYYQKNRTRATRHVKVLFTSGSKNFLSCLQQKLIIISHMGKGSLSPHGLRAYNLAYSFHDARQLRNFMYPTYTVPCLKRKLDKFKQVFDK